MAIYVNINKVLQNISSLDKEGESTKEIDTKEEYKYLGAFLNGQYSIEGRFFDSTYNYVDLSKEDKKLLFDKMKSLEEKFGPWENKFDKNKPVNINTASDYLRRYEAFHQKLSDFENKEDKAKYYEDIKDELAEIENKLRSFCNKYNITTELSIENSNEIENCLWKIEPDIKTQEFLKNYSKDFKITKDNAYDYACFLEYITEEDYTPSVISPEDNKKAVDILKKSLIEFLQPHCEEELNDDNILTNVSRRTNNALWKIEQLETESNIKAFLNGDFDISTKNIDKIVYMSSFLSRNNSAITLSPEECEQAKTKLKEILNNYAAQYLTEEQRCNLGKIRIEHETIYRIRQENNGTYKKYEAKIAEMLSFGDKFKITGENAESYVNTFEYLCQKKLDSSCFTDEEFSKACDTLANAYLEYIRPFNYGDDAITADDLKSDNIRNLIETVNGYYAKLSRMKKSAEKVQQCIDNPYDNSILQNKVKQYIRENNIPKITNVPEGVDIGNGKFDRISTQKNENCWAHAGIYSLLTVDEGRTLVESNYYRDNKTGVIAIHIQEAEDAGLHDGIFYVTPQEIIDAQDTVASGEGEITAYIIAFQKYFDEVKSNPELKEKLGETRMFSEKDGGNLGFRVYELLTGGVYTEFKPDEVIKNEEKISKGIGISTSFDAKTLYKMIENKEGVMTISLRAMEHNISVIGVKDGKFLIQESNNDPEVFDRHIKEDDTRIFTVEEPVNGRPTFGITIDDLDIYNLGAINYIKFK